MAEPTRRLTVDEENEPIKNIIGQDALMGADTVDAEGETVPGQFDLGKAEYEFTPKDVEDEELLATTGKTLDVSSVSPTGVEAAQVDDVVAPTTKAASTIDDVERTYSSIPVATAAQGTLSTGSVIDPNQVVDERTKTEMLERGSLSEAKTQTLAAEATTKYQVEQLMTSLNAGAELPPWVSPAVRKVRAVMNQRGLGASSMAAAAMAQSMLESAIPIANSDAQKYANLQLQNLTNEQQTALANAATISSMDKQNLDNKMKAAQQNASSFLQMDLANLTNEQATSTLNHQVQTQALFNDQAAANAASQFNATSQNQVNQFYDQLGATVSTNNANRQSAMEQFNTDQTNSIAKYNAKIQDSRDKFNSTMQLQIEQANVAWRRAINTENTSEQNTANKINSAAILGITTASQANLWQKYRDDIHYAYTSTENSLQRAQQLALTTMQNAFSQDMFDMEIDATSEQQIGSYIGSLLNDSLKTATTNIVGGAFKVVGEIFED